MKSIVQVVQNLLKPYIDSNIQTLSNSIAPTEDGTKYSKIYYKGDEFYRNGQLCKLTASSVTSSVTISSTDYTSADDITTQLRTINTREFSDGSHTTVFPAFALSGYGMYVIVPTNKTISNVSARAFNSGWHSITFEDIMINRGLFPVLRFTNDAASFPLGGVYPCELTFTIS